MSDLQLQETRAPRFKSVWFCSRGSLNAEMLLWKRWLMGNRVCGAGLQQTFRTIRRISPLSCSFYYHAHGSACSSLLNVRFLFFKKWFDFLIYLLWSLFWKGYKVSTILNCSELSRSSLYLVRLSSTCSLLSLHMFVNSWMTSSVNSHHCCK